MALLTTIGALNPDIEKYCYVDRNFDKQPLISEKFDDLKDTYLLYNIPNAKIDDLKNHIYQYWKSSDKDLLISFNVYNYGYILLEKLYPHILEELNIDNITPTPYGTLIFDWEKDRDNIFSLEIGSETLGYFIEVNGNDIKQVDSISLKEGQQTLLKDLSHFLIN